MSEHAISEIPPLGIVGLRAVVCAVGQKHAVSITTCLVRALFRMHRLWSESGALPVLNVLNGEISDGGELLISKD